MKRFFILLILVLGCSQKYISAPRGENELILMTYNVENLFDTEHDEGKDDYTYLPINQKSKPEVQKHCQSLTVSYWKEECLTLDWSEAVLKDKMDRLSQVILQVNDGQGPDVLYLQEVENHKVLSRLVNEYLKGRGYSQVVLIEGPDERGIDTALVSKLPLHSEPKLHLLGETPKEQKTRGILQADFSLPDGSILTALSVHFPSQHGPTSLRIAGVQKLNQIKATLPADRIVIAAGDFNITKVEDEKNKLLPTHVQPDWYISHYIGCSECSGTHSYRGSWSFLDMMLFSKNLGPKGNANWEVIVDSIGIPKDVRHQVSRFGTPERFGGGKKASGVADHFPLVTTLKKRGSK